MDTKEEMAQLIVDTEAKSQGVVTSKSSFKQKTVKGEIVDEYFILTITEDFTK